LHEEGPTSISARCPVRSGRLARECLRLARLPFTPGYRLEDGLREELSSSWRSVGTKESQRAISFFFVRQTAKAHAIGSAAYQRPDRVALSVERRTPSLRQLARILEERRLPGVDLRRRGSIAFATGGIARAFTCVVGALRGDADCSALLPFPTSGSSSHRDRAPGGRPDALAEGAALFQVLEQAGFTPVVTRARDRFVSERLLEAFADAAGSGPSRVPCWSSDIAFRARSRGGSVPVEPRPPSASASRARSRQHASPRSIGRS